MKFLGLLQLALAIYAIAMIVQSGAQTGAKVLWVALVLILPIVGLILWGVLGPGSPMQR